MNHLRLPHNSSGYSPYNRRNFLKSLGLLGAGTALSPLLSACASSQTAEECRSDMIKGDNGQSAEIQNILKYAILAPSGHNTQPWKFSIQGNTIRMYPDYTRRLPVVDPDDRELFISLGCALENLVIASAAAGYNTSVEHDFNDKNDCIIIKLEREPRSEINKLFDAIKSRQCTRSEYNSKPVPVTDLKTIQNIENEKGIKSFLITESKRTNKIIELVKEGNNLQMNDDAFYDELQSWIRFSESEAYEKQDGLYSGCMGNPTVPRWIGKIFMNLFFGSDSQSEDDEKRIKSSSGIMLFTCESNDKLSWVNTGRTYERWALTTTMLNIKSAFINQPVEIPALRGELESYLSLEKNIPQLLLRFGYSQAMPYSYRRKLDTVLVLKDYL